MRFGAISAGLRKINGQSVIRPATMVSIVRIAAWRVALSIERLVRPFGVRLSWVGGGVPGSAWMAGLAAELRRRGIDLGSADTIVGTSAGAVVGAALITGRDLYSFADDPRPPGSTQPPSVVKPELLATAFSVLFDRTLDRDTARRKLGRMAMAEQPAQPAHIEPMEWLVGGNDWPDHRLRIVVVDAASGQREVWDSGSGVPLATAVTASRSFPGAFPPVVVGDRYYIDGGVWSPTNADLAADADLVLIVEPLAHRVPPEHVRTELATTVADTVVRFGPDGATIDVFKAFATDPDVLASWPVAFQMGVRQADELAQQLIRAGWLSPKR
ncbi:patatin-like phospholipase family protein [Nocardia aurantiaca]|uniref:Patatin-like phospholipase family protein n=1 Tax=Nocardia aurantiaca TaxID=2675850 RepID=A0A6I3KYE7_9NOCA|nr:patatin-like phospholipase family protein [Nocardia aurantiaca]MTE14461.1 patatin-like phospholipase family protein [Nocardia aurantiaca]